LDAIVVDACGNSRKENGRPLPRCPADSGVVDQVKRDSASATTFNSFFALGKFTGVSPGSMPVEILMKTQVDVAWLMKAEVKLS
jgi:hypothetical protein